MEFCLKMNIFFLQMAAKIKELSKYPEHSISMALQKTGKADAVKEILMLAVEECKKAEVVEEKAKKGRVSFVKKSINSYKEQ